MSLLWSWDCFVIGLYKQVAPNPESVRGCACRAVVPRLRGEGGLVWLFNRATLSLCASRSCTSLMLKSGQNICLAKSLTSNRRVGCWGRKLGCRADTLAPLSRNGGLPWLAVASAKAADRRPPKRRFGNRRSLLLRYKRTYGSSITKEPKKSAFLSRFCLVQNG